MKKNDLSTYNSDSIATFDDDSIKILTDTINQQIAAERAKSLAVEQTKLVRVKTSRDIVPTAGELRTAYVLKSQVGDTEAVEKITEVGLRLKALCPDRLKVDGKAPDNFKDESIFIDRKYIQPNLKDLQFEIDNAPKVTYIEREKKSRSQDYGISM